MKMKVDFIRDKIDISAFEIDLRKIIYFLKKVYMHA